MNENTEIFLLVKTTKRFISEILIDISNEACLPFGFLHGETVIRPDGLEAVIGGVSLGNNGVNQLWYSIKHTSTENQYCYYENGGNLLNCGFKKKAS